MNAALAFTPQGVALAFTVAAAASILAWLLIRPLLPLLRRRAMATPNERSSHRVPTPQGGGIAVVASAIVCAAAGAMLGAIEAAALPAIFAGAVALAVLGGLDDIYSLGIVPRMLVQGLAIALLLYAVPQEARIVPALPWEIERAALFLALMWFVNLANFMDGIDWMTVAETVPVCGALAIAGFLGALPAEAALVALALGGAMAGFAPYNRPVARLFIGDVGSLPVGFLLGWMLLLLALGGHLAAALLLPLYYGADATLTLLRRLVSGERFWEGHRSHFYQRAVAGGMTVPEVIRLVFATNLVLAALALVSIAAGSMPVSAAALAAGCAAVGLLLARLNRGAA